MPPSKHDSLAHPTINPPDRRTRTFSAPPNLSTTTTVATTTLDLVPTASASLPSSSSSTTARKNNNPKARRTTTTTNGIPAVAPARWWMNRCTPSPANTRLPLDLDMWLPQREFEAKMRRHAGRRGYTRAMLAKTAVGRKIAAAAKAAGGND